jgi:hypothetical protein
MGTTRKRKLALKDINRCHPSQKTSRKRCLPDSVYKEIATKLGRPNVDGCADGEEHCVLDNAPLDETVKKQLRKQYLRPRRPKAWIAKPNMWLDNYNILNVMKQYEEAYPTFSFLGVFPIDFSAPDPYRTNGVKQCLNKELCELNLNTEYDKGKRGIGMIFNLDPHFKGGSHWVGLYINLENKKKPFAGYFDSYGYETPKLIARLMRSFKLQVATCDLGFNARRFQYGDSECGMFSMYFLICMLSGISFKEFCKDAVNDKFMLDLRKIIFSM